MRLGLDLSLGGRRGAGGVAFPEDGGPGMTFADVEMSFGDVDMTMGI